MNHRIQEPKGFESRASLATASRGNRSSLSDIRDEVLEREAERHTREPHTLEPPREPEDKQSHVPVPQVGEKHGPDNRLVDILEHSATDALAEAANTPHAHIDRARRSGSTIVK